MEVYVLIKEVISYANVRLIVTVNLVNIVLQLKHALEAIKINYSVKYGAITTTVNGNTPITMYLYQYIVQIRVIYVELLALVQIRKLIAAIGHQWDSVMLSIKETLICARNHVVYVVI